MAAASAGSIRSKPGTTVKVSIGTEDRIDTAIERLGGEDRVAHVQDARVRDQSSRARSMSLGVDSVQPRGAARSPAHSAGDGVARCRAWHANVRELVNQLDTCLGGEQPSRTVVQDQLGRARDSGAPRRARRGTRWYRRGNDARAALLVRRRRCFSSLPYRPSIICCFITGQSSTGIGSAASSSSNAFERESSCMLASFSSIASRIRAPSEMPRSSGDLAQTTVQIVIKQQLGAAVSRSGICTYYACT